MKPGNLQMQGANSDGVQNREMRFVSRSVHRDGRFFIAYRTAHQGKEERN